MGINVTQSSMPDFEEYVEEIGSIWDNIWLTNIGPKHNLLEQQLCEYLDVPYISLFMNGHNALEIAIQAFDLKGEVLTTPYSFASTTSPSPYRKLFTSTSIDSISGLSSKKF